MLAATHPAPFSRRVARIVVRGVGRPIATLVVGSLRWTGAPIGVALMYHSVAQRAGVPERELVPPHPADIFAAQIRYVGRHYNIVSAARLQDAVRSRRRGQRIPLSITFDDDLACHERVALPILLAAGVTATFFLSGASLERPFSFWYERLQRAHDEGVPGLAELVMGANARDGDSTLHDLARAIQELPQVERDAVAERLGDVVGPDLPDAGIRAGAIRTLAEAGMTIGFHTRRHDALALLSDVPLGSAMEKGREELAAVVGAPLEVIGYPHGSADRRVAAAARAAGFAAGYTTQSRRVTPDADPLLLGRVGPSLRSVGALALELALVLIRPRP